ncbi:hypothetical protein [Photobacterium phosphoreum]|uniref:hypothetical protein n=1 Tax=Photobacterium phosphoreum TaxID=659 RepID=UPI000D15B5E1|nr:hypothetical protein [Photobacterium phosphoreum]PTB33064.1 hypothetical protein DAT36_08450 [Photobacterium phosphoreum]
MSELNIEQPWNLEPSFNKADIDIVMKKLTEMSYTFKESINKDYDWAWTLGTKKYGWAVQCIEQMNFSREHSFLGITRKGLGQFFTLNGVSVSLVTDNLSNRQKTHRYTSSVIEDAQLDLFKEGTEISPQIIWRLILDISLPHQDESEIIFQPIIALIGLKNDQVVSSYTYNEVFVPKVIQQIKPAVHLLPKESQQKPLKLQRKKHKTEISKKQVNE